MKPVKTAFWVCQLVACSLYLPGAWAQQAPKLPKDTLIQLPEIPPPAPNMPIKHPKKVETLSQVPMGAPVADWAAPAPDVRGAEVALLTAQSDAIKQLSRRLELLEAKVQVLEAAKKKAGTP